MRTIVEEYIIPYPHDGQPLREAIERLITALPDTFVLSRENPVDNLSVIVKLIGKFYKDMASMSNKTFGGKLKLSMKQREAVGLQRRLKTEIHICRTYINTRKKQLEVCKAALSNLLVIQDELSNWLINNSNTLVQKQAQHLNNTVESYLNSCTAFENTIQVLDTSVAAVNDFLTEIIPSWDAQISRSEKISISINAELKKWD